MTWKKLYQAGALALAFLRTKENVMSTEFDYYYTHEAEQFTFYRIPKALFTEEQFYGLSVEAKVLYGLMLDRVGLSLKSGWVDDQQRVYIYFTVSDIEEQLQCGHNKAIRLLKELDAGIGLIQRKRQGLGKPDRIYVMNFSSGQKSQNRTSGDARDTTAPEEVPESTPQKVEKETSSVPETGLPKVSDQASIKNENIKTNESEIESIHLPDGRKIERTQQACLEYLKDRWGYVALKNNFSQSQLDGVFSLGADILSSSLSTVRVSGQDMPRQQVEERLLSLDFTHVEYVLDAIGRVTQPIHNMRSYLLTSLYNAPTTIDAYYDALVARDNAKQQPKRDYYER